jgi:hypothetical protein
MLTSFRLQVIVVAVHQQVVALVVRRQVALVHQQVVALVARQQVVVAQLAFALLQAVPQAFAGKIQQTELCLPLQVAVTFSSHLPPNEFCS